VIKGRLSAEQGALISKALLGVMEELDKEQKDEPADGRVAPGSYPPGAPTDPDVRNSRIRLLGSAFRCTTVNTVNHARRR
jgi:hypothetical protein